MNRMASMHAQVKVGLAHFGSATGGFAAAVAVMSSRGVDIYALVDSLNSVVVNVTKLVAVATPIVTGFYGIYMASTRKALQAIIADPKAPQIAEALPVTPQTVAVADALKAHTPLSAPC